MTRHNGVILAVMKSTITDLKFALLGGAAFKVGYKLHLCVETVHCKKPTQHLTQKSKATTIKSVC